MKKGVKGKAGINQEGCLCFCEEDSSREAPFQVPIEVPLGFTVDPAEAVGNVTWNTDNLACISEPCLTEAGVVYGIRLQGTIELLVSVEPVRNKNGQGEAAISEVETVEIDQIVYYSGQAEDCPDLSQVTVENIVIVPPFYGNPLTVTGTFILVPEQEKRSYVFTANTGDSTVSVIDAELNTVVKTIPFAAVPTHLGVTFDKAYTYVLHGNTDLVSIIDNKTLTIINTITVGGGPRKIEFDSTNEFAYVMAAGSIYIINMAFQSVINVFPVPGASDFALDPNGQFVYIANTSRWSVDQYDVNTGQLAASIMNTFEYPSLIQTPYAGNFAYVMNNELWPKNVTEISLSPLSRGDDFDRLFDTLRTIVFSADSTRAYFLETYSEPFLIDNLHVVDTATQSIIANVSFPNAFDLTVTPDNQYIYAAQPGDNTVTVYRTSDYTAVTVIPVGAGPSAIAM
ncbi:MULTISPECIES: YncE family protein [unclassified Bacillus (in: firmicutes)]|uniref:YncE family protein n=1 Tax=unclassified Bacillus (in: firmicutes) TaxID=185979 RepID=UPI0022824DEF|nr:YncE family protein [Bacillus sp. S20C3]MCY8205466.1 YncE family protein [Bacillus sp. N12A5]MCY8288315.1 YncE family protein [Bacillus sp. N13C7]MCY8638526.1 YncE family protein [Bacillus sp. S17B2]MCY9142675.1 YncE family protein [Bacillus sp. T9C1]